MAKYRRSKTNTTFFMDIPKSDKSRWKDNLVEEDGVSDSWD